MSRPVHVEVGDLGQVRSPGAGEVPCLGGVIDPSIQSLFFFGGGGGVAHQGGLPGQPIMVYSRVGRAFPVRKLRSGVTRATGVITSQRQSSQKHTAWTTWLPTTRSVASYFNDFTSKTATTLTKLTVLATII